MLKDILNGKIQVVDKVDSWRDAIRLAAKPLVDNKLVEVSYVDAMVSNVEKFGDYILIEENIALPHSRPEHGVNENCLALLKVTEGVTFDSGEKAYLFFALGAKDSDQHIVTLQELMDAIEDEDKVQEMIEAKTVEELTSLI